MRLFVGTLVCFFGLFITGKAQKTGSISGCLQDSVGHQLLQGASIRLLTGHDSTAIRPAIFSDKEACFALTAIPLGKYLLQVNFVGYESYNKDIVLNTTNAQIDLGTIYLHLRIENLNSVSVIAPPLIVLKKDTVEYNAATIKSTQYDALEDLLKKLPGIQIGSDGALLANGIRVEQLLIDGKPFFGGDPAIALQNLPADIVNKVQVYKAKSDQEVFTGFSHGPGKQTINISVKKNMAKGDFGKAGAGGGTQNTWSAGLNLNHFDGPKQISLLGSANNINNQSNPVSTSPFNEQSNISNTGIARNLTTGVNYRDSRSRNLEGNGSYLYNTRHSNNNQESIVQSLFPHDSSTTGHQRGITENNGNSQNFSFKLTGKPDKTSMFTFSPGFVIQRSLSNSSQQTILTGNQPGDTLYRSSNQSSAKNESKALSADLSFMQQFPKTSGSLVIGLKLFNRNNNINNLSNTQTEYRLPTVYSNKLNKLITQTENTETINPTLSFVQPINNHQALEINYSYTWRPNRSSNQTYNYNSESDKFDQIDTGQSNDFKYIYQTHLATLNYRLQFEKWQIVTGIGLRSDLLSQKNITLDSNFKKQYQGLVPSLDLNYTITPNQSMQMNYTGSFEELTVQQLQPVNTTTDSLFIQKGNPSLRQPFKHTFSLSYRSLQPQSMKLFSVNLNGDITRHAVANSVLQLANGAQVYKPVNLNGDFNVSLNASYGMTLKRMSTNVTLTGTAGYVQSPGLLNNIQSETRSITTGVILSTTTTIKSKLDLTTNLSFGYSAYQYAFGNEQAVHYFSTKANAKLSYFLNRWTFSANASYNFNSSLPAGFRKDILLLSPAVSRRIFRNKAGEIRFLVFDILNQNSGVSRNVSGNIIQNLQSEVRGRYGMITFTYTFRHFPGLANKPPDK